MQKKPLPLDESRIYTEDGVVKVRHIAMADAPDMTPHPTESRIFVKDGEVVTVLSEKLQRENAMSVEEARTMTIEAVKKIYQINGKK